MSADYDCDAIVVGAGHNGLVTALYLARVGWKVIVFERAARIGGAVKSAEVTLPGFVHDVYSTNQNLFRGSPVYAQYRHDLERHGLRYCESSRPYANVFPNGASARVYQDPERTLDLLRRQYPQDAEGWAELYGRFRVFRETLLPLLGTALPSLGAVWVLANAARKLGLGGALEFAQIILSSTRELGDSYLASEEIRSLIACWGMHPDFGPSVSGGAMFPFVEAFADMESGMSIVEGGASRMVDALAGLLRELGGKVRTEAEVVRVVTSGERAVGVELASGEQISARRAVVADLTPTALFGRLLAGYPLPSGFRRKVERFTYAPGSMMIHLALSGRAPWDAGEDLDDFAYLHVAPYVDDLDRTYTNAISGYLPSSPLLIVGQTSVLDPSRAPDGRHVLWVQVRVLPDQIRGDADGRIAARTWDEAKEPYADRVIGKLETYAPGIKSLILARKVLSPDDLERDDPNLVGGDNAAGSHHLRQNFLFRPFPGWSNYRMPLEGLYMVGASTWPGGGTNAASGYLAAQEILHPHDARDKLAAGAAAAAVAALLSALAARRRGDRK